LLSGPRCVGRAPMNRAGRLAVCQAIQADGAPQLRGVNGITRRCSFT
jgi:hypothetical protein